jgi:hypothetical protein
VVYSAQTERYKTIYESVYKYGNWKVIGLLKELSSVQSKRQVILEDHVRDGKPEQVIYMLHNDEDVSSCTVLLQTHGR